MFISMLILKKQRQKKLSLCKFQRHQRIIKMNYSYFIYISFEIYIFIIMSVKLGLNP